MNFSHLSIKDILLKGSERSVKAKKNIIASFLIKGLNILCSFLLIRVSLEYLDQVTFGIWLVLYSIIEWFNLLDIGLGNGLRNKLAEAKAKNDTKLERCYVSTAYMSVTLIILPFLCVFVILNPYLNWVRILNAPLYLLKDLRILTLITFFSFSLRFVAKLINSILYAYQKPAVNDLILFVINVIELFILYILLKTTDSSLLYLGSVNSVIPVFVLLTTSLWLYSREYKNIAPSFRFVKKKYFSSLINLGTQFFIMQISIVAIFSTDNLIITHLFGPAEVTPYNIARKYFNIVIILFNTITAPFWSAITDAYHNNEKNWIKNSIVFLKKVWLLLVFIVLIMIVAANMIYKICVGGEISIPFILSLFMGFFSIILCWNSIYGAFLNGVGKIRLQMYTLLFGAFINIPLSIFLGRTLNLGSVGVIMASCICISIFSVIGFMQYRKIIEGNDIGIWGK